MPDCDHAASWNYPNLGYCNICKSFSLMLDLPPPEPQIQSPSKPNDFAGVVTIAKSSYSYQSHAQKNVKYCWVPATITYSNLDYSVAMEHNLGPGCCLHMCRLEHVVVRSDQTVVTGHCHSNLPWWRSEITESGGNGKFALIPPLPNPSQNTLRFTARDEHWNDQQMLM